jgi:SpoVK/Ycf46/Vps4 family AAA+-type ATPase
VQNDISENDMKEILRITNGYSCADMQAMIREAAMQPVRELPAD